MDSLDLIAQTEITRDTLVLAETLGAALLARQWRCVTAESCTGGGVGAAITMVPGSSAWFDGGGIVYSNALKSTLLGVAQGDIERHGPISDVVVRAGPDGGTPDAPVGLVYMACAFPGGMEVERCVYPGDRASVRAHAVRGVLGLATYCLKRC
ncbi:MAG: CinA family protein [Pseudomonadota bacterium]